MRTITISLKNEKCKVRAASLLSFLFIIISFILFTSENLDAQIIPINDFRNEQLDLIRLHERTENHSLFIRPLSYSLYNSLLSSDSTTSTNLLPNFWGKPIPFPGLYESNKSNFKLGLFEPKTILTHNSSVPYGYNNESAWYGNGINTEILSGLWFTSKFISANFRPHFVWQQNRSFEAPRFVGSPGDDYPYRAEAIGHIIDAPYRFGNSSFYTLDWGYSSINLHYKSFQAGISTEPQHWGPSLNYPLLLSNNAPGFLHFYLSSRSPVSIRSIGSFEYKYIAAFPEDSDYYKISEEKEEASRFINGIILSLKPNLISNFYVGFARIVQTNLTDNRLQRSDLGLILDPFFLENFIRTRGPTEDNKPRVHMNSLFFRWLLPANHIEIFGEFYREDYALNSRDLFLQPRHNSGYSLGVQYLLHARFADFYRFKTEFTNLTPSYLQEVRRQEYFYTNPTIQQGYTHRGQLLGAAIGSGSNSQKVRIDAYKSWGRIGLFAQRTAVNNHFHYNFDRSLNRPEEFRQGFGDYWRNRTDLTIGINGFYLVNKMLISGKFSWTRLFNYGRFDYGSFGGKNITNFTPYDKSNIHLRLSIMYII